MKVSAQSIVRRNSPRQSRIQVLAAIRRSAIREFSLYGFAGASTQAIAEGAGISKSALHYYIEDKESLYVQLLSEVLAVWDTLFEFGSVSADQPPAQILDRYLREKLAFAFKNPELSRIFTTEVLSGGHRLKQLWPGAVSGTDRTVAVVDGWIRAGRIRALDARLLVMHLWAMTQYYADYAAQAEQMLGKSLHMRKTREHIADELVAFVLCGCGLAPDAAGQVA